MGPDPPASIVTRLHLSMKGVEPDRVCLSVAAGSHPCPVKSEIREIPPMASRTLQAFDDGVL
jgi:hypothetical protein